MDISIIVSVIGVLVALTNVIVQVAKKATYEKMPTNVLALVVAEVLTIVSGIAYLQIKAVPIVWYMIVALIVGGFLVAYAAMFGFDKLKEIMNWGDQS
jgi:hypothetical protein